MNKRCYLWNSLRLKIKKINKMADEIKKDGQKRARTFDFMEMYEQARQTAVERTQSNTLVPDDKDKMIASDESESSSSSDSDSDSEHTNKQETSTNKSSHPDKDDLIGPPMPVVMTTVVDENKDDDMIGPLPPKSIEADDSSDSEADEEESYEERIPSTNEILLDHGVKTVSALALDPSGARLISGGFDYDVKFWDFAGMDTSLQSFRKLRPCESHPIKQLQYSTTGDVILVIAGNSQPKIIDRDGFEVLECIKGDQYLTDMARTKGHTAMTNGGCWHPKIREEFLTCANDGTVRLWDINNKSRQKHVIKMRTQQGRRAIPTACAYSIDGRYIAAACQDGSIQLWDHNRPFVNVSLLNRTAHMNGSDTSCLCFSYDGRTLASRGGDDTLKMWDLRNFKKPLKVAEGLTNYFPVTDCVFSPDDKMIVTGISVKKGEGTGRLLFLERETLHLVTDMDISESSVVRCLWHPKLNQIVVGSGDGNVRIYYDEKKSHRGAMLCMVKTRRKAKDMEVMTQTNIITPYALPMFRVGKPSSTRKQEEKARKDPILSKRPDLPVTGQGVGGRVGAKGATLSQYVAQQIARRKPDPLDKDPRTAILRHAQAAKDNPYWIAPAYAKNQPVAIFQEEEKEVEEDDGPMWKKLKTST